MIAHTVSYDLVHSTVILVGNGGRPVLGLPPDGFSEFVTWLQGSAETEMFNDMLALCHIPAKQSRGFLLYLPPDEWDDRVTEEVVLAPLLVADEEWQGFVSSITAQWHTCRTQTIPLANHLLGEGTPLPEAMEVINSAMQQSSRVG